jgi:hypothetical protein
VLVVVAVAATAQALVVEEPQATVAVMAHLELPTLVVVVVLECIMELALAMQDKVVLV